MKQTFVCIYLYRYISSEHTQAIFYKFEAHKRMRAVNWSIKNYDTPFPSSIVDASNLKLKTFKKCTILDTQKSVNECIHIQYSKLHDGRHGADHREKTTGTTFRYLDEREGDLGRRDGAPQRHVCACEVPAGGGLGGI